MSFQINAYSIVPACISIAGILFYLLPRKAKIIIAMALNFFVLVVYVPISTHLQEVFNVTEPVSDALSLSAFIFGVGVVAAFVPLLGMLIDD